MRCPSCDYRESRVIDSRPSSNGRQIRRRRLCPSCNHRFTTYETFEESPLVVVKKDGRREEFSNKKLLDGFIKACEKRSIPLSLLESLVEEIAGELRDCGAREITVSQIGEKAVERLLDVDMIAYVRFVSVYKEFKEPEDFLREVEHLFQDKGCKSRRSVGVRVKLLRGPNSVLPRCAHPGDAGVDLVNAGEELSLPPGGRAMIPTGIAVAVPDGYELQIRPRSGLAMKHGLTVVNSPGTIDSGYRGEISVIILNTDREKAYTIKRGEKIAQAVLARCETIQWLTVDELDDTGRGEDGFGSTGSGLRE